MAPLYKRALPAKKIQWLGLNLSPPLLLGLSDGKDQDEHNKEWEEEEKNDGFYPHEGTPTLLPWEVRGSIKALKEMQNED